MVFRYAIISRFIFDWIRIFAKSVKVFAMRRSLNLVISSFLTFNLLQVTPMALGSSQESYVMTGEWLTSCQPIDIDGGCIPNISRPLVYPSGIAMDSSENVYVVDAWTKEIQKFTNDGKFLTKWGKPGGGNGEFRTPVGIAIDSSNSVYVVDHSRADIQKFTNDGKFLTKWGKPGGGNGEFITPVGIAIDSSNNVYIVDLWLTNIQKFTNDGKFLTKWGTRGTDNGQFLNPKGIAVDPLSNVYVVDQHNNRIQKFDSDGKYITKWGTMCEPANGNSFITDWEINSCFQQNETEFFYPNGGIATDELSNIYVVDQHNNRIQKFTPDGKNISTIRLPDYRGVVPSYSMLGYSDIEVESEGEKIFTSVLNDKILVFSKICNELNNRICQYQR